MKKLMLTAMLALWGASLSATTTLTGQGNTNLKVRRDTTTDERLIRVFLTDENGVVVSLGSLTITTGALSTAGNVSLNAGTAIIGQIGNTSVAVVQLGSPWGVDARGSSVVAAISNTSVGVAQIGAPWRMDAAGSSTVAYQGTSPWAVDARGSSVVATLAAGTQIIGNLGNTSMAVVQLGSPWGVDARGSSVTAVISTDNSASALAATTTAALLQQSLGSGPGTASGISPVAITIDGWYPLTATALTGVTNNATTTLSVTFTASYNGGKPLLVKVCAVTGAANFWMTAADTSTVPTTFSGTVGDYLPTSSLEKAEIEFATGGAHGPHIFLRTATLSGAASGTAYVTIWRKN